MRPRGEDATVRRLTPEDRNILGSMFWLGLRHRGTTGPVLPLRRFRDRDPAVVDRDGREFDAVYGIQSKVYGFLIVVVVIALVVVGITNLFR